MKKLIGIIILLLIVSAAVIILRAPEVKPDLDNSPAPTETTDLYKGWKDYSFNDINLSFKVPPEMEVSGEKVDSSSFILTVQRSSFPNPDYYQLYGNYNFTDTKKIKLDDLKKELDERSIEETTVDGFPAVKGQYKGQRNRFVTQIVTDKGIFTLATSQPTSENRDITDTILDTFDFK